MNSEDRALQAGDENLLMDHQDDSMDPDYIDTFQLPKTCCASPLSAVKKL